MLFSTLGLTHPCFPFLCCIHSVFHRRAGDMKWAQGTLCHWTYDFQVLTPEKTGLHLPSLCYLTSRKKSDWSRIKRLSTQSQPQRPTTQLSPRTWVEGRFFKRIVPSFPQWYHWVLCHCSWRPPDFIRVDG